MTPALTSIFHRALRELCDQPEFVALRVRNAERAERVARDMGRDYLLHPDNRVRINPDPPKNVLRVGR